MTRFAFVLSLLTFGGVFKATAKMALLDLNYIVEDIEIKCHEF